MLIDSRSNYACPTRGRKPRQAHKQNTAREPPLTVHQFTEVLVHRDEHVASRVGQVKDNVIGYPRLHFRHVAHDVTVQSQTLNDLTVNALVGREAHAIASVTG